MYALRLPQTSGSTHIYRIDVPTHLGHVNRTKSTRIAFFAEDLSTCKVWLHHAVRIVIKLQRARDDELGPLGERKCIQSFVIFCQHDMNGGMVPRIGVSFFFCFDFILY